MKKGTKRVAASKKAATADVALRPEQTAMMAVNPQALIARAIDKNLPIESMERLLAMRRELRAEWAREQYFKALAQFQRGCPTIGKGKRVDDKSGRKRYSYAPLDQIVEEVKDLLADCGFSYSTAVRQTPDTVTAICDSHHRDGHSETTEFMVPIDHEAYMNEPQKVASALTYATRYAFRNAFGIMTGDDDDDAQSAGKTVDADARDRQYEKGTKAQEEVAEVDVGPVPKVYWTERKQSTLIEKYGPAIKYMVRKNEAGEWRAYRVAAVAPKDDEALLAAQNEPLKKVTPEMVKDIF
jgi:hypothetical protein